MTKWQLANIYLRSSDFATESFSFEEAKEYLANTDFGNFTKASWNAMIKNKAICINENGNAFFSQEMNEDGPINSEWTNTHRHTFYSENGEKSGIADFFSKEDIEAINRCYWMWKEMGELSLYYGCRRPNLPELVSEGLLSALYGWGRTNNLHLVNIPNSADLVDTLHGEAIQVKGISTIGNEVGGPTSFGSKTQFDRFIVMHVRLDENKAYFYEMKDVKNYKDWTSEGQRSLNEQMASGQSRPRIKLMPIIEQQELTPFAIYDFNTGMI